MREQWLVGLVENRLTNRQAIVAGLRNARRHNSPWLPSIGMFVQWCRDGLCEIAGLPDSETAFQEWMYASQRATFPKWEERHPALRYVHRLLSPGAFNLYQEPEDRQRKKFMHQWESVQQMAIDGQDFALLLPKPEEVPEIKPELPEADRGKGEEVLGNLLNMFP